jgi:hypothetical protein
MNIIFGKPAQQISDTHTVLELDTFKLMPSGQLITTYCVVDTIPLAEFPQVENNKKIHEQLMTQYRQQNWEFCRSAAAALTTCWNGELDTFYQNLLERIDKYSDNPPDADWTGIIVKEQA